MHLVLSIVALLLIGLAIWQLNRRRAQARERFIRTAAFPPGLAARFRRRHPSLGDRECDAVADGLRQFFLVHLKCGRQFVSMPSQVVDDLWHEFILYTRNYERFCRQAFGRFLHHTPAVALRLAQRQDNTGLRRCWWYSCKEEDIDPRNPDRLPLLFALDAQLGIEDGFRYVPDCRGVHRQGDERGALSPHCGSEFSDPSFDGGLAGFGDGGSADSGSTDADGGGCGGDSGGGCGGGD